MLVRGISNVGQERPARPFAFAVRITPDSIECYSGLARSADDGGRLVCTKNRLCLRVEVRLLDLKTGVFDLGKMVQERRPAFDEFLFWCIQLIRYRDHF